VVRKTSIFYGWYIVGVGFLCYLGSSFALSSTLSVFLKPLTAEFGVSRGVYSLVRTGEVLLSSVVAVVVGPMIDRYGARWLIIAGALIGGTGYILLSRVWEFWQFMFLRWLPITVGDSLMGYMVVNVMISRWFIRKRGRAISIANTGTGIAKVGLPLFATWLFAVIGWRDTWALFGALTFVLVVVPAFLIVRRSPEDMGLNPDGALLPYEHTPLKLARAAQRFGADIEWTRREALRTPTFWLLVCSFGIVSVGVIGLNLHIFPYVTDIGYSGEIAATVMGLIALTQIGATLFWGLVAERVDVRKAACSQFILQALGLAIALANLGITSIYLGFLIYGFGLGGSLVVRELLWANYFGRVSLGRVRGLGFLITRIFTAGGAPFFGFFYDYTHSYRVSFICFITGLLVSGLLLSLLRPPQKAPGPA
jgi:MFS family permease